MDFSESGLVRKAAKVLLIFYSLSTASGERAIRGAPNSPG
jgi:hypothetical protein